MHGSKTHTTATPPTRHFAVAPLLLGLGAIACGSTDGVPAVTGLATPDAFEQARASAICERFVRCGELPGEDALAAGNFRNRAACLRVLGDSLRPPALVAALARGVIRYDAVAARRCIEHLGATCPIPGLTDHDACREAYVGSLAVGASCASDAECAPENFCEPTGACSGICRPAGARGAPCGTAETPSSCAHSAGGHRGLRVRRRCSGPERLHALSTGRSRGAGDALRHLARSLRHGDRRHPMCDRARVRVDHGRQRALPTARRDGRSVRRGHRLRGGGGLPADRGSVHLSGRDGAHEPGRALRRPGGRGLRPGDAVLHQPRAGRVRSRRRGERGRALHARRTRGRRLRAGAGLRRGHKHVHPARGRRSALPTEHRLRDEEVRRQYKHLRAVVRLAWRLTARLLRMTEIPSGCDVRLVPDRGRLIAVVLPPMQRSLVVVAGSDKCRSI